MTTTRGLCRGLTVDLQVPGVERHAARLVKGKPAFDKDAPSEADFSSGERDMSARAAGRVADLAETDSPRPDNGRTAAISPLDRPNYPQERDRACTGVIGALTPEVA